MPQTIFSDRRIFVTADDTLVEEGDPAAVALLVGQGSRLSQDDADKYTITQVDGKLVIDGQAPPENPPVTPDQPVAVQPPPVALETNVSALNTDGSKPITEQTGTEPAVVVPAEAVTEDGKAQTVTQVPEEVNVPVQTDQSDGSAVAGEAEMTVVEGSAATATNDASDAPAAGTPGSDDAAGKAKKPAANKAITSPPETK
jgi:hypothetical protein